MRRDGDHDDGQKRALVLDLVNDIDTAYNVAMS